MRAPSAQAPLNNTHSSNPFFIYWRENRTGICEPLSYLPLHAVTCRYRYLRPDPIVHRILADMGRSRGYVPATNTEQDVIETVFSPHRRYPPMPRHRQSGM